MKRNGRNQTPFPRYFLKMTLSEIWSLPWQLRSKSKFHLCNLRPQLALGFKQLWGPWARFPQALRPSACLHNVQVPPAFWIGTTSICSCRFDNCLFNHLFACTITQFGHICICKSWIGLQQNDCTCKLQPCPFINPGRGGENQPCPLENLSFSKWKAG